jgi:predicted AlkP superfamily phosphohydrolase/phosphomutase
MSKKVVVIAFDGLDKDLIEEFGLENLTQQEFGSIDNVSGMSSIKTSELFASFITGKNFENHGVKGIRKWDSQKVEKAEKIVSRLPLSNKTV